MLYCSGKNVYIKMSYFNNVPKKLVVKLLKRIQAGLVIIFRYLTGANVSGSALKWIENIQGHLFNFL